MRFREVLAQDLAQFLDGVMHDEADVAGGEAGDVGDFLVGTVVEELETDDFALVGAELIDAVPDAFALLTLDGTLARIRLVGGLGFEDGVFAKVDALFFTEDVEGAVPTDGVEPGFEVVADFGGLGEVEAQQGVLHDVAPPVDVSPEDASGVGDELRFILVECSTHQNGGFILVVLGGHVVCSAGGTGWRGGKLGCGVVFSKGCGVLSRSGELGWVMWRKEWRKNGTA